MNPGGDWFEEEEVARLGAKQSEEMLKERSSVAIELSFWCPTKREPRHAQDRIIKVQFVHAGLNFTTQLVTNSLEGHRTVELKTCL